jgi:hypothetical protein
MEIATTTTGRKVHMVWQDRPMCGPRSGSVDQVVGSLGDGLSGTISGLQAAKIAPSRLCGHCFAARTRAAYRAQLGRA